MSDKPVYYSGDDIIRISNSKFVGATYDMHVAANLINKEPSFLLVRVFTYGSQSQLFTEFCAAGDRQNAERIAATLNACKNVGTTLLAPGRMETVILDRDKQTQKLTSAENRITMLEVKNRHLRHEYERRVHVETRFDFPNADEMAHIAGMFCVRNP